MGKVEGKDSLPPNTVPRARAKSLQGLEHIPLLRVEEAVWVELPRIHKVIRAMVGAPVLDFDTRPARNEVPCDLGAALWYHAYQVGCSGGIHPQGFVEHSEHVC